jgi:hypothetical protein
MIERHWNADLLAKAFGALFIIVGLLGFAPNPLVSPGGVFEVDTAHNIVHLVTGILFLIGAYMGAPVTTIRVLAIVCALVALVGFIAPPEPLFGVMAMNLADRWLHLVLALVLLLVGFLAPMEERFRAAHF